jgi:hypothetical protein
MLVLLNQFKMNNMEKTCKESMGFFKEYLE